MKLKILILLLQLKPIFQHTGVLFQHVELLNFNRGDETFIFVLSLKQKIKLQL